MKPIIPLLIFALSFPVFAHEPLWKNFAQENTVLIAHVDFTKIDITQTLQTHRTLVETLLPALLSAEVPDVQEAYFVMNLQMPKNAFVMIVPQTGNIDPEMLQQHLPTKAVMTSKDGKYLLFSLTEDENVNLDSIIPATPMERPDFAEAFKAVDDAPIKIALALPGFVRKVVKDTAPKFPPPFEQLDIAASLAELRWLAVGIDPAKPTVNVTATMTSELAALNAQQVWQKAVPMVIENIDDFPALFSQISVPFVATPEIKANIVTNRERIQTLLTPQAAGKNLTVRWEKPQWDEIFALAAPLFQEMAASGVDNTERQQCAKNVRIFVLAFHNHHDNKNHFPPPFTVDATGKPLHSWRVLVLPYLEQSALYQQIRLDEPWDSAHNKQFHDEMPAIFRCPANTLGNPNRDTVYCMVVGKDMIGVPDGKGISIEKITDGTSNTILIVERKTPVCWMEPTDVLQEHAYLGVNKHEQGIGSEHRGVVVVGLCDGSSHFLKEEIDIKHLKGVLTKAGSESINLREGLEFVR